MRLMITGHVIKFGSTYKHYPKGTMPNLHDRTKGTMPNLHDRTLRLIFIVLQRHKETLFSDITLRTHISYIIDNIVHNSTLRLYMFKNKYYLSCSMQLSGKHHGYPRKKRNVSTH